MAHIAVEPQDVLAHALENPAVSASPDVARLLGIARAISAMPDPEIDAAFVARLEARLLTETFAGGIEATPGRRLQIVPAASPAPDVTSIPANVITLPRRRFVVRRSLCAAIAAATLTVVPIVASGSAIPGSTLYPLKKSIERLHLALTRGPVADGFLLLDHADRRLDEVDQLVALGRTDLVPPTLDAMNSALRRGTTLILRHARDAKTLRRLANTLRSTTGRISTILESAPAGVQPALYEALVAGRALSLEVDAALGIAEDTTPPESSTVTLPQDPELSPVAPEDLSSYFKMDPYYQKTPARNEVRGPDNNRSDETRSPCLARMYVGPGAQEVHSACATVSNETGDGDEQDPTQDGPVTRHVGPVIPPVPQAPPPPPPPAPPAPPADPAPPAPPAPPQQSAQTEAVEPSQEAPANEDEAAGTTDEAAPGKEKNAGKSASDKAGENGNAGGNGKAAEAQAKKEK